MYVCGVDEAGRGSLLGPLVIAGISINKSKIKRLSDLGVKDSKRLTPDAREKLYKKIIKFADNYYVTKLSPRIIDRSVKKHELNNLEAKYMAKIIAYLNANISYVDSCDVNAARFGRKLSKLSKKVKVKSYHKADSRFIVVSAASIIAKVTRDRAISRLQKKHNLGSGYPSDSKTITFVKTYMQSKQTLPTFIRTSWKSIENLSNLI